MAVILNKLLQGYDLIFNELSDPRSASWPLMSSPIPTVVILGSYLYFVRNFGPKMMEKREAYKLKTIMILYNAVQVVMCSILVYLSIKLAWGTHYRWVCEPVDYSDNENALSIAKCVYFYYIIKLTDLIDTIFFVFRKKNGHLSFLHVYHHTGMVVLSWSATKFLPGGHGTLLGVINCVVHIVMYSYYLLTLLDDKYKNSIWWKKYITQMQIVQFLLLVLHYSTIVFVPDCAYPRWIAGVVVPQNLFMLLLFLDFYRKAYMKPTKVQEATKHNKLESKPNGGFHNDTNGLPNGSAQSEESEIKDKHI